ncbi:hypothetical protein C2G38_1326725 [Gigaspora rosea]|uniref:Uncharacterized protein n=1 Tax=Gigaspora rosea TaxID=44941 RepID=A0A397VFS5_9GLOM|nr:hypothetical protein C2G38_1326725 [Gigaspora rosea]
MYHLLNWNRYCLHMKLYQMQAVLGYEKEAVEFPTAYVTIKNGYKQSQALAEEIQSFVDEKVASYKKLSGAHLHTVMVWLHII